MEMKANEKVPSSKPLTDEESHASGLTGHEMAVKPKKVASKARVEKMRSIRMSTDRTAMDD